MAKSEISAASKPKAMSLHIGLNAVSPTAYGGRSGELSACEFDANDMAAIAASSGMKSTVLLTKSGTRTKVLSGIRAAAKRRALTGCRSDQAPAHFPYQEPRP